MNIAEAITSFLQNRRARNCRMATIGTYQRVLGYFAAWLRARGVVFARDLSVTLVEEYLSDRMGQGLQASTVKSERGDIVMFCKHLSKIKAAPKEEWGEVLKIKQDEPPPKVLSDDRCCEMVQAVEHILYYRCAMLRKRDLAILGVLFDAGLRAGELIRLNLEDINIERCSILVSEQAKSRKARVDWFSDTTARYIRRYLEVRGGYAKRTNALFITRFGGRMKYSTLYDMIVRVGRLCGWDVSPHVLRHTNITSLINGGLSLSDVQLLAGHANPATTAKYVHLAREDVRQRYKEVAPMDRLKHDDT